MSAPNPLLPSVTQKEWSPTFLLRARDNHSILILPTRRSTPPMNRLHPFAKRRRIFFNFVLTIALSLLLPSLSRAQSDSATPSSTSPFDNLKKNPELLAEFGRLLESLRIKVQLPSPHSESRLLPLLPDSTLAFASFSNYGP